MTFIYVADRFQPLRSESVHVSVRDEAHCSSAGGGSAGLLDTQAPQT